MSALNSQNRINELISIFVTQVKGASAMSRTDLNKVAENVLIPVFKEAYGLGKLRNLNADSANYPGIDLADDEARVAFQITADPSSEKIKDTLRKCVAHRVYEKYDEIIVYIISEKQSSYSGKGFDDAIDGRFVFDRRKHIRDYSDLLRTVSNLQAWSVRRIEQVLEANFGDGTRPFFTDEKEPAVEPVFLNLLPITLPKTLFSAEALIERDDEWDPFESRSRWSYHKSKREAVTEVLKSQGLSFGTDWVCFGRRVVTFHDLSNYELPLSRVVDPLTVTRTDPAEFYVTSIDHEHVFKSLLWRSLQQLLFQRGVRWQNQDEMFIFVETDDTAPRKERWYGKKWSSRTVYERTMRTDPPDEVRFCKHFGFSVQFNRLGGSWYLAVKPDWFFSYDGYNRADYCTDRITYLKVKEKNQRVFNHLRFAAYFMRSSAEDAAAKDIPGMLLGNLITFENAPLLDDKAWAAGESGDARKTLYDTEGKEAEDDASGEESL